MKWAVDIQGTDVYFRATLLVVTADSATAQEALEAAEAAVAPLRAVRQLGPTSNFYDALQAVNARPACL